MKKIWIERFIAIALASTLAISSLVVFAQNKANEINDPKPTQLANNKISSKVPKYVFLFIGDGMSYPQIQAASDYLGAMDQKKNSKILTGGKELSFMGFEATGSATTYDSTSFCPDSASTATSISTGNKTYSSVINMDESMTVEYETITEKLKEKLGYKVGVISTVNLNHATPAAFYPHQASRNNYYEIGVEMVESGFDFFQAEA